ncbi:PR domain zinc finger protein 14 [Rhypophila decipiens]
MDPFRNPPADSLAAARLHIQALTDCGLPAEALLRALLESYGPTEGDTAMTGMEQGGTLQQSQLVTPPKLGHGNYNARLSVSTTSSRSSGRASVLSTATSLSSVSSQGPHDMVASAPVSAPAPTAKASNRGKAKAQGAFWCTFCDVAFQRKFDWKRHEDEFHERYKRYPCPSGCGRVFWGANTFNQHHKNAHGCTTCPHADSVVKYTQRKTAWACGFCAAFLTSRDRYFDHVARHYEDGCNKGHWNHSHVIYGLLHQPSISHAWKELHATLYDHLPRAQQPMFEWDPRATGHAPGFLEGESPGKLQDLLEFFDDSRDDARFLARLAHDQAVIRYRNELPSAPQPPPPPPSMSRPIMSSMSSSSAAAAAASKHMSAPQQPLHKPNLFSSEGAMMTQPFETDLHQQQQKHQHRIVKKQRSMASSMSGLTSPLSHNAGNGMLYQHTHTTSGLMGHSGNGYPQTIIEAPETCNNPFFDYQQHQQNQQHQQHQQHPQHLVIPGLMQHGLFEDWSSITTTVVDESSPFSPGEGWDTGAGAGTAAMGGISHHS